MNLTNYHSHSTYCDGRASLREFVEAAVSSGFTSYGFSSHAPLPFQTAWNMNPDKLNDYLAECSALVEEYKDKIDLYIGLEIDYLNDSYNPSIAYFQDLPLDYRIGSVHFVELDNGEYVDLDGGEEMFRENIQKYFNNDYEEAIIRYFDANRKMINLGGFDILGHCDKVSKNASLNAKGICQSSFYLDLVREYLELIAEKGYLLEINTKGYDNFGMFFPNKEHFSRIRELEIPVLVNSDCHRPELVNSGRVEALKALASARFDSVIELKNKEWMAMPIHSKYHI